MLLDQHFNTIHEKLQQLLRQQARLKKENERLQEELARCRQAEADRCRQVAELEQRIAVIKMAAGDMNDAEKRAFETQINRFLKEIDRCIAYLSQ